MNERLGLFGKQAFAKQLGFSIESLLKREFRSRFDGSDSAERGDHAAGFFAGQLSPSREYGRVGSFVA